MATIIITDVTELQAMENDLTADYALGNNIDASATSGWNGGLGFEPIGKTASKFTGSFDGKGFTINNLFIDRPTLAGVGLFGLTDESGEIKNVGIVDCDITGKGATGALVGQHDVVAGKISNCYSTGTVTGHGLGVGGLLGTCYGNIEDCYSTCSVTGVGGANAISIIGGLVGGLQFELTITRCYSTGAVTVTSDDDIQDVGGFIGSTGNAALKKCYATGDVSVTAGARTREIGGFIGSYLANAPLANCYARGAITVSAVNTTWGGIGGFVGIVNDVDSIIDDCYSTGSLTVTGGVPDIGGFCGDNFGTITNCFWDTITSGQATSDGGTGKTTTEMKTLATFTDAKWNFTSVWSIDAGLSYPVLITTVPTFDPGYLWEYDTRTHLIGANGEEIFFEGALVAAGSNPEGTIFAETTYFHSIDEEGDERRTEGVATGDTGPKGTIFTETDKFHVLDHSAGAERTIAGD